VRVNFDAVVTLLETMLVFGVERLVNFSSIGVLPRVQYEPIDAAAPAAPARLRARHRLLRRGEDRRGGVLLRIPPGARPRLPHDSPLGRVRAGMNPYPGPIKAMVEGASQGESVHFPTGGAHPRSYTHAEDIAGLVLAVLEAPDDADRIFYGATAGRS